MPAAKKPTKTKAPKTAVVREHLRRVPVSKNNPSGKTIVDRHLRHIDGQYLDLAMIVQIFENYEKKSLAYPAKNRLEELNEDKYDDYIAVWVDYFNRKLKLKDPLDPNLIKALIASESTFNPEAVNKTATGLTQVTTATLKILQNLEGETKDFVFKNIRKKDLKNPNVSIALGTRWIAYKKIYAERVLKRTVSSDEVVQVYKGILKDNSKRAQQIMKKYRNFYNVLKK